MEGIGEVGDIGEVAVGHAYYVIDAKSGLVGYFRVTAIVEVLFIGIEVAGWGVGMEAGLVRGGMEIAAEKGIIGRGETEALGFGDRFGKEDALEESGDIGKWEVVGGGEIVGFGDDAATGLVGTAFENAAEGADVGNGVEFGGLLI